MVRFVRTAWPAAGKQTEALEFGQEVTEYLNANLGTDYQCFAERYGRPRVHWAGDFEDMASLDKALKAASADEGYLKLLARSGDLFLPARIHDTVVETVETM